MCHYRFDCHLFGIVPFLCKNPGSSAQARVPPRRDSQYFRAKLPASSFDLWCGVSFTSGVTQQLLVGARDRPFVAFRGGRAPAVKRPSKDPNSTSAWAPTSCTCGPAGPKKQKGLLLWTSTSVGLLIQLLTNCGGKARSSACVKPLTSPMAGNPCISLSIHIC